MSLDERHTAGDTRTSADGALSVEHASVPLLRRPLAPYYLLVGSTSLLLALGLVMVLSASSITSYADNGSSFTIGARQAMWVALGIPAMWLASRMPIVFYRRVTYPLLLLSFVLLIAVLIPGVGFEVNGNRNWIEFGGPFRLQPSEFAKFALVLWGADLLARKERTLGQWRHVVIPLLPVAGAMLGLVLLGGDLGTSLVLMAITGSLMFFAGAPMRLLTLIFSAGLGLVAAMSMTQGYRRERFRGWLDPSSDPLGAGWQALHGTYALASGGWWGLGLGAGREKWGGLPEAHTDFIFAVIGEELGLFGTLIVIALIALICYSGLRIALHTPDTFVRLAAASATTWIMVQATVNLGAVLGVLPITGIPLPLVSYGGSALLPTMVALGMLMAFARREPLAARALAMRGPGPLRRALREHRSEGP